MLQCVLEVLDLNVFQIVVPGLIEDSLLAVVVQALSFGCEKGVHSVNFILYSSYMVFFH